ncbi:hypothetical protein GH714_006854 [Hevea brasiliensis]|uniref:Uncharacterized protein n=1 Tax=Hevea brasiliensis TaxID=3981 RepID=A0A6A6LBP6_HEVBR|nr:hypothetical protein GH714_006854 [Hevea brasiliensis]
MWPDSRGVLWRDVLQENARKEFEEARFEKDPEIVTRLLIGGRDAVQCALEKLAEKHRQQIEKERGHGGVLEKLGHSGLTQRFILNPSKRRCGCFFGCRHGVSLLCRGR